MRRLDLFADDRLQNCPSRSVSVTTGAILRLALAWRSVCPVRHLHFFARLAQGVTGGLRGVSGLQIKSNIAYSMHLTACFYSERRME